LEDGQELDVDDLKASEAPTLAPGAPGGPRVGLLGGPRVGDHLAGLLGRGMPGFGFRDPGPFPGPAQPNPMLDPGYFVNMHGARPAGKAQRVRYDRLLIEHAQRFHPFLISRMDVQRLLEEQRINLQRLRDQRRDQQMPQRRRARAFDEVAAPPVFNRAPRAFVDLEAPAPRPVFNRARPAPKVNHGRLQQPDPVPNQVPFPRKATRLPRPMNLALPPRAVPRGRTRSVCEYNLSFV
jgi:hypothetical protein